MDIEERLVAYLGEALEDATVAADVPRDRGERLVTIERTGGEATNRLDHPTVAIQSWCSRRADAAALAKEVDEAMADMPLHDPTVAGVERTSLSNWPDPDSDSARYQGVYQITTPL